MCLDSNPADAADPPRVERPTIRTWSGVEVGRFLEVAREDVGWPLWQLAASTGMRRGELLGVRWEAVDLDGGSVDDRREWQGPPRFNTEDDCGAADRRPRPGDHRRAAGPQSGSG